MGRLNVKLMQGIDETEKQIQKEKKPQPAYEPEKGEGEFSDRTSEVEQNLCRPSKRAAVKKNIVNDIKNGTATNMRVKKQVFSFRAELSDINIWKAFATSCGKTMESIGTDALNEYVKRHRLSEAELAIFNALLAKNVDM